MRKQTKIYECTHEMSGHSSKVVIQEVLTFDDYYEIRGNEVFMRYGYLDWIKIGPENESIYRDINNHDRDGHSCERTFFERKYDEGELMKLVLPYLGHDEDLLNYIDGAGIVCKYIDDWVEWYAQLKVGAFEGYKMDGTYFTIYFDGCCEDQVKLVRRIAEVWEAVDQDSINAERDEVLEEESSYFKEYGFDEIEDFMIIRETLEDVNDLATLELLGRKNE